MHLHSCFSGFDRRLASPSRTSKIPGWNPGKKAEALARQMRARGEFVTARLATRYKKLRQFANQGSRRRETPRIPRRQMRLLGRTRQKVLTQGGREELREVGSPRVPIPIVYSHRCGDSRCGIRGMKRRSRESRLSSRR